MRKDRYGRLWQVGDTVITKTAYQNRLFNLPETAKIEKILNHNNESGFVLVLDNQPREKTKGYDPAHFVSVAEKVLYVKP